MWRIGLSIPALLLLAAPSATAQTGVTMRASINARAIRGSTDQHPVRINPRRPALLDVTVRNRSARAIDVRVVRLEGRVLGLTLMAFDTQVGMAVPAGATATRRFEVDVAEARNQATGLIPGSVRLLDRNRHLVASEELVADVRGSAFSVYSLFGIGVAIVTAISFLGAILALARGRLSPNRWWRGTRFLTVGFGIGLVLIYSLSAMRVWAPRPGRGGLILAVSALVLFGLGYLTPTPEADDATPVPEPDPEPEAA